MNLQQRRVRRRRIASWRRIKRSLEIPVFLGGMLLLLPVLLPVGIITAASAERRMRKAADAFRCSECRETLGEGALEHANVVWTNYSRELRQQRPGMRINLVRAVDAICTRCGTQYSYSEMESTFTAVVSECLKIETPTALGSP